MRLIQLVLAVAVIAGLLALAWFAVRTEPAQAKVLAADAGSREDARPRGEGLDAQAESAAGERIASERALLAGTLPEPAGASNPALPASSSDVFGRVVDRDGRGIPGADVYASNGLDWVSIPLDVEPESAPKGWIEIERATTDAAGRFAIEGLEPGAARLAVRAPGFAPRAIEDAFVPDEPPRALPDIVLEPGVVLSGRVIDATGNGVRGAMLLAALDGGDPKQPVAVPGRGVPLGRTGENGEFRVDRLAAGPWHLIVDSAAHVVADARGETRAAGEVESGLVIRLEPGMSIEGRIQWSNGGAPADIDSVRISARPSTEAAAGEPAPPARTIDPIQARARHAIADAEGRFELRGLIAGVRYRLTAAHSLPEDAGWKSLSALEAVLAFAGERGVVLAERPSTALSFRVVDATGGAPLTELTVAAGVGRERLLRDDDGETRTAFAEGRVRVPDLRAQASGKPIQLRVSANGYRDYVRRDIAFTPGIDIDLGEVRLAREHKLAVTVVDDHTGAPIEDARVFAGTVEPSEMADYLASPGSSSFHGAPNLRFGRTLADGRVHLTSYPGVSVNVCADAKGFRASAPRAELCPVDVDHAIEIRLARGGVVTVRVSDPSGRPLAKMGLAHLPPGASPSDDTAGPSFEAVEFTNALGLARFDALAPGLHSFRPCDGPPDAMQANAVPWTPIAVEDRSSAEITLIASARAHFFGRVTEGGAPLARARLRLVERKLDGTDGEENEVAVDATADRDGRFSFVPVRAAQYELWIAHSSRRMAEHFPLTLLEGDNTDEFDLGVASIEGRVLDEAGEPMPRVDVSAAPAGEGAQDAHLYDMEMREDDRGNVRIDSKPTVTPATPTDEQGRYLLRGVRTGEPLVINVRGEAVESASSAPLSLGPGEVRRGVDFVVRRAGMLELSLTGEPASGSREWFEVRVESIDPAVAKVERRTHLGAFLRTQRVRGLGPGRYRVRFFPMGNEASPRAQAREIEIAAGEVQKLAFDAR